MPRVYNMRRLNLNTNEKWLVNYVLNTSGVGAFTAFNSSGNGNTINGDAGGYVLVGSGRAGAGSYFRRQRFENRLFDNRNRK